jgi:hypothetical protein
MRVITAADLANKTNVELSALYARIKEELARTKPDSYEHEVLSLSLDNIRRAFVARVAQAPKL